MRKSKNKKWGGEEKINTGEKKGKKEKVRGERRGRESYELKRRKVKWRSGEKENKVTREEEKNNKKKSKRRRKVRRTERRRKNEKK